MTIKILLADDHKMIREGLRMLIKNQPGMEVVGEAEDGRTAIHLAEKLSPDVVILDVSIPGLNGIEATRRIIKEKPGTRIIGLSLQSEHRRIAEMFNAGASGYLLKNSAFKDLVQAIHEVMANRAFLCSRLNETIDKGIRIPRDRKKTVFSVLSEREREVLQLIAEGFTTRQIAAQLHISIKTVETHRLQIMKKLNIFSIAQLTKYAIREGITSLAG